MRRAFFADKPLRLLYSALCKTYESVLSTVRWVPYVEDMGSPLIWPFVLYCATPAHSNSILLTPTDPTLGRFSCSRTLRSIASRLGLLDPGRPASRKTLGLRANDSHIYCSQPDSSHSRRVLAIVTIIVRHTACTKPGRRSTAYSLIMRWVQGLLGKEAGVVDIRLRGTAIIGRSLSAHRSGRAESTTRPP